MKSKKTKFWLFTLGLLVASLMIALYYGKSYTLSFQNILPPDFQLNVDGDAVEVVEVTQESNTVLVHLKAKKPGQSFITLDYGDSAEGKIVYVHKSFVITEDNFFGKSTASEVIPISLSVILLYAFFLTAEKCRRSMKENLYRYQNILLVGFLLYLLLFTVLMMMSIFDYQGIFSTVKNILGSVTSISMLLLPITFVTFVLVTFSNFRLLRKEGASFKNLLGLFLGIFLCFFTLFPDFLYEKLMKWQIVDIYNLNSIGPYAWNFFEALIHLTITYLECMLFGTIYVALKAALRTPAYDKDYMIILGCQIRKDGTLTPLLKGRVEKALQFRNRQLEETNKDLIFIPSGGKGKDEIISEGEAMKNYLIEVGIPKKNILVETKSTNTYENLKFSSQLISKKQAKIAFSTTNYHVFRAGLLATEQGLKVEGIGSNTKAYFWINAFIREFIGTLYAERKKHIQVFLISSLFLLLMIVITYFAYNL